MTDVREKISIFGIFVNLALGISKITVGLLASSAAILADGLHSSMDVISSAIGYIGIRYSKKPVDKEHPYGHYKAEVLSGFIITIILFATGLWIIYRSINSFIKPEIVVISTLSVAVVIVSAVVNEITARVKIKYGKKYDSISLVSDGTHDRIDTLTSVAVLVGLVLSKFFLQADSIVAILIGIYIVKESFSLGKEATHSLLDVSAGPEIEKQIKTIFKNKKIKLTSLKTQKRGPKIFAELEVSLPANLKVQQASEITKELQKSLIDSIGNLEYVTIQIKSHEITESYYKGAFGQGMGWQRKGRMHGEALGPGGDCICPKCGYKKKHQRGVPCSSLKCPKCNVNLTRGKGNAKT